MLRDDFLSQLKCFLIIKGPITCRDKVEVHRINAATFHAQGIAGDEHCSCNIWHRELFIWISEFRWVDGPTFRDLKAYARSGWLQIREPRRTIAQTKRSARFV